MLLPELKLCERCHLHKTRTQVVLPRGNPEAKIVFTGEAPGRMEDMYGKPFVGQAGSWFTAIVDFLGLTENCFYLTNVVKCRPTTVEGRNRKPLEEEIKACSYWYTQELAHIKPKVLVLMGQTALDAFFVGTKISNVAGEEVLGHIISRKWGTRIFALFHPATLVYNQKYYLPIYKTSLINLNRLLTEEGLNKRELTKISHVGGKTGEGTAP